MNNHLHKGIRNEQSRGVALLIFMVIFLMASFLLTMGIARGVYSDVLRFRTLERSMVSYFASESAIEDAIYRHRNGMGYSATESFAIAGANVSVVRSVSLGGLEFDITSEAASAYRNGFAILQLGTGASFNFGLQSGNGGISMSNNSSVTGNVFSNGTVVGQGSATVYGDVISAGSTGVTDGLVNNIHATGSVWSHAITNSTIDEDAYYYDASTFSSTVVTGVQYPGSPDQATTSMPIDDATIDEWKTNIETNGTVIASTDPECLSGTYTIETATTLGDVKIECNVVWNKKGSGTTITLDGAVWIEGNLDLKGVTVEADAGLGTASIPVIVDNEADRLTSSKVSVTTATAFAGTGSGNSFIMLLSMNNSAENGGPEKAIDLAQSATGDVLVYASHGRVDLGNSISLKEVTAYQIDISNGAGVIYESGLVNLNFTGGPGGGYEIGAWDEVQ